MSGLPLTFTAAGLAALVNAQSTGSAGVTIASIGLAGAPFTVAGTLTALPNEIKQLATFGGGAVDPATMHVSVRDDSTDTYDLFGFGLYLNGGTLFAVYSQPTAILGKATVSEALLSFDVRLSAAVAGDIHFGDTAFLDPPATTERAGLVELATVAEATTGTDTQRAVTPAGLKAAVLALINGAPGALDTLAELAAAMANDANFAGTVTNALALKAPLVSPALSGNPTAPTRAPGDATIAIATTAFVENKGGVVLAAAQVYADTKKAEAIAAAATDASSKSSAAQANAIATAAGDATAKANAAQANAAADATGKANTAQANAIATAAADATGKANTAQANAIATAAGDATAKANAAQANAIATAAGDATAKANAAQANAAADAAARVAALEAAVWQPGDLKKRAFGTVPAGWYHAVGQAVSRVTDAALFAAIGTTYGAGDGVNTFNLPNYGGEFLRGWDPDGDVDPGRGLGTWQDSQNRSHTHGLSSGVRVVGTGNGFSGTAGLGPTITETDSSGGAEARPRNYSVMILIKR